MSGAGRHADQGAKPKIHTLQAGFFPNAMRALAEYAQYGSAKHGPGEPMHWAWSKSTEHAESASRHLSAAGTIDPETGKTHTLGAAMRVLMLLETELIEAGAEPGFAVQVDGKRLARKTPTRAKLETFVAGLHPAQKLAVEAFAAEELSAAHPSNWECANMYGAAVYVGLYESEARVIASNHGLTARPRRELHRPCIGPAACHQAQMCLGSLSCPRNPNHANRSPEQ